MSEDEIDRGFSPVEERALSSILNEIIPPSSDARLPGAGEIGLSGAIAQALQETPEMLEEVVRGLSAVDDLARRRGARCFAELSKQQMLDVMNEVGAAAPGFLPTLIFHTYLGYYQNGRVIVALGLEHRPPHPTGYDMEPVDLTLLDGVRQRPKLYREC